MLPLVRLDVGDGERGEEDKEKEEGGESNDKLGCATMIITECPRVQKLA